MGCHTCWLNYFTLECLWCGRTVALSVYGHVITKFSRMGRLPHFLSYGAPTTRGASLRGGCGGSLHQISPPLTQDWALYCFFKQNAIDLKFPHEKLQGKVEKRKHMNLEVGVEQIRISSTLINHIESVHIKCYITVIDTVYHLLIWSWKIKGEGMSLKEMGEGVDYVCQVNIKGALYWL